MTICIEALTQAAMEGAGYQHLTPAQAWAAHHANVSSEKLEKPLASSVKVLLEHHARKAEKAFKRACSSPDAMIEVAFDDRHPAYLRLPVRRDLDRGMRECFPDLKPTGIDEHGEIVYSAADLAKALGVTEDELIAEAELRGVTHQLHSGPLKPIH